MNHILVVKDNGPDMVVERDDSRVTFGVNHLEQDHWVLRRYDSCGKVRFPSAIPRASRTEVASYGKFPGIVGMGGDDAIQPERAHS
jgi:hypothetical protein